MFYYKFKGIVLIICGKKVSSKMKHLHIFYYMWHAPIFWDMFMEVLSSCRCHKLFRLVTYSWISVGYKIQLREIHFKSIHNLIELYINTAVSKTPTAAYFHHLNKNEPRHDKTNKMACAPSEDSDQPRHPPSLIRVFAVQRTFGYLATH